MNNEDVKLHEANQSVGSNPLVSIIIPVFNAEKYLHEALVSLIEEDYQPREIIMVDDGSTDGSIEIARQFDEILLFRQENRGVSLARNFAIEKSKGEFISFLDGDDIWITGRTRQGVDHFLLNPATDFVLGMSLRFLDEGIEKPSNIRQEWLDKPQYASNNGVMMARRHCFDKVGLFNPEYTMGEDTEWIKRAMDSGLIMNRLPFLFLNQRVHHKNTEVRNLTNFRSSYLKIVQESLQRKRNMYNEK